MSRGQAPSTVAQTLPKPVPAEIPVRPIGRLARRSRLRAHPLVAGGPLACLLVAACPPGYGTGQARDDILLFRQPSVTGMRSFCVLCHFPPTEWSMVQFEANPYTPDGSDIESGRSLGAMTGLEATSPQSERVLRPSGATSGAVMQGDAVGAFLRSEDVNPPADDRKFIITPNIGFPTLPKPFGIGVTSGALEISFDLQVPTASDRHDPASAAYIVSDLNFLDRKSGASIYLTEMVFKNGFPHEDEFTFIDVDTRTAVAQAVATRDSPLSSVCAGAEVYLSRPWRGWRHFCYSVDAAQAGRALDALRRDHPELGLSADPADWSLHDWHMDNEILFATGPATLGWSLRHTEIRIVKR